MSITDFDMTNIQQVANSIIFCEDMLECAQQLDLFVDLALREKSKSAEAKSLSYFLSLRNISPIEPSFLQTSQKYSYLSGGEVVGAYINHNLITDLPPIEFIKLVQVLSRKIRDTFTAPSGTFLKEAFIGKALDYLDTKYDFVEKVYGTHIPTFMAFNNGCVGYNSGCLIINRDGVDYFYIHLYHLMPQTQFSPEYIYFHELGHVVHAKFGSRKAVPDSFLKLNANRPFLDLYQEEHCEDFANAFAMVATFNNQFSKYAPQENGTVAVEIMHEFCTYFSDLLV